MYNSTMNCSAIAYSSFEMGRLLHDIMGEEANASILIFIVISIH